MSNVEINTVLAQMRAMSAAASNSSAESATVSETNFSELLQGAIEQVSESQVQAKELATAFESGDPSVELPQVMVALQKASLSFQAMNQVRNKLLSAYQEVMNMQV
jgi:flagellar hook-basal body complex protein FliE